VPARYGVTVRRWPGAGVWHRVATAGPHGDDVDVDVAALAVLAVLARR